MRLGRSTAAALWFRVAVLITLAQVFLSYFKDEWWLGDFLISGLLLAGTGVWVVVERRRLRLEQRRRRARWICVHCGYDLRATPERCPECGAVPFETWEGS